MQKPYALLCQRFLGLLRVGRRLVHFLLSVYFTPNRSTVCRLTEVCAESFRFQAKGFVRELESQLSDIALGTLHFSPHDRILGCADPDSSLCSLHALIVTSFSS